MSWLRKRQKGANSLSSKVDSVLCLLNAALSVQSLVDLRPDRTSFSLFKVKFIDSSSLGSRHLFVFAVLCFLSRRPSLTGTLFFSFSLDLTFPVHFGDLGCVCLCASGCLVVCVLLITLASVSCGSLVLCGWMSCGCFGLISILLVCMNSRVTFALPPIPLSRTTFNPIKCRLNELSVVFFSNLTFFHLINSLLFFSPTVFPLATVSRLLRLMTSSHLDLCARGRFFVSTSTSASPPFPFPFLPFPAHFFAQC